MNIRSTPLILALAALLTLGGCSINHPVADDYAQYLSNNTGSLKLPSAKVGDSYALSKATQEHHYEFRSFMTGQANLWVVEFGKILDATLASKDVVDALGRMTKVGSEGAGTGDTLVFSLVDYRFEDHGAHVALEITVKRAGKVRFSQVYRAGGVTQGGKMFFAGVFGMKNAIQQSTKSALDDILARFVNDYSRQFPESVK